MTTAAPNNDWVQQTAALRRLARALVGSGPDAEDLVQDALLAGWQRGDRSPSPGWLRSFIRSRSVDLRRREGRRRTAALAGQEAIDPTGASPDAVAEHIEIQQGLLRAVRRLGPAYRDVIYLRYFEGLGANEIADRLNAPRGTIKARLSRGLAQLQAHLDEDQSDQPDFRHGLLLFAAGAPLSHSVAPAAPIAISGLAAALLPMKIFLAAAVAVLACVVGYFSLAGTAPGPVLTGEYPVAASSAPSALDEDNGALDDARRPDRDRNERTTVELTDPRDETLSAPARSEELALSSPPQTGALEVRVTWHDGTLARNLAIVAMPSDGPEGGRVTHRSVTDAAGEARMSGLRAGEYTVRASRGGRWGTKEVVEVEAGAEATLALELDAGVTVTGLVRQPSGAPVADARIWMTSMSPGWTGGQIVAHTDAAGRFRIRDARTGVSLGALADGWAPSALVDLDLVGVTDGMAEVELELREPGGTATIAVRDSKDRPLPGALVAITRGTPPFERRLDMTSKESWTPRTRRTDASGELRFEGLGEGLHEVHVRAASTPRWSGSLHVQAGAEASLQVRLDTVGEVIGRAVDTDGSPLRNVVVRVVPPEPTSLADGPGGSPFAQPWTETGEDGRFRLFGVAPGAVTLEATLQDSPASAETSIALRAGETATWNPVLDEGRSIVGRLLYSDRSAVGGAYLIATEVGSRDEISVHVSGGDFILEGLRGEAYDLRLESLLGALALDTAEIDAHMTSVVPTRGADAEPIEWILEVGPPAPRRHYVVRAEFEDRAERLPDGAAPRMILQQRSSSTAYLGRADKERGDDAWLVNMLIPAQVTPVFLHGGRVVARGEPVDLDGTGDVDLGTIRSAPGATLDLEIARPLGLEGTPLSVELSVAGLTTVETIEIGAASTYTLRELEPGAAIVRLVGQTCMPAVKELQLEAGEAAALVLELTPAALVSCRVIRGPEGVSEALTASIHSTADGQLLLRQPLEGSAGASSPFAFNIMAPVGRSMLTVESASGSRKSIAVEVPSLDASVGPLELNLR